MARGEDINSQKCSKRALESGPIRSPRFLAFHISSTSVPVAIPSAKAAMCGRNKDATESKRNGTDSWDSFRLPAWVTIRSTGLARSGAKTFPNSNVGSW